MAKQRISKIIANAGIASRRKAETLIENGCVKVNGKKVKEQGTKADPFVDEIYVNGVQLDVDKDLVYLALNKPRGYLVTKKDDFERKTVYDLIPKSLHHLHPVGRLDKETSGLLLLTNDGDFTLKVTHPRYEIRKQYRVSLKGRLTKKDIDMLSEGFEHPEFSVSPCFVENFDYSTKEKMSRFLLDIGEGKKREIRKIFEYLEYDVSRLHRVQIGQYRMSLAMGRWEKLSQPEVKMVTKKSR